MAIRRGNVLSSAAPEVTLARVLIGSLEKEILEKSKIKVAKSFCSKFTFTISLRSDCGEEFPESTEVPENVRDGMLLYSGDGGLGLYTDEALEL